MKTILCFIVFILCISCGEKIYLYKAKLSSSDINGTSSFGPKNTSFTSKAIKDPLLLINEYDNLGTLVSKSNVRDNNPFINFIYLNGDYGDIDSVYVEYLKQKVLPNYVPKGDVSKILWSKFYSEFKSKNSYKQSKQVLFDTLYTQIRKHMERSIYDTISTKITQEQKIEKIFKGKLESNVEAVLKQYNTQISADIKAEIMQKVNNSVKVSGSYLDITLDKVFKAMVENLLLKYKYDFPTDKNTFIINYYNYFQERKDFLSDGYGVLHLDILYNTSQLSKQDIVTTLNAESTLTADQKNKIAGEVYASFSIERNFKGEAKSTKYYLVKYQYSQTAESNRAGEYNETLTSTTEEIKNKN
ncbi:hypothetical protein GWA97_09630 [Flavobacterium sp. LaA7.5]|nr:hypothetical protein [Flavobacterium salilacus subsp. altitudinum]